MTDGPPARLETIERYPGVEIVHAVEADGTAWGTRRRRVLRWTGGDWQIHSRFPRNLPRDLLAHTRLATRVSRSDQCVLAVSPEGAVLGVRGGVAYAMDEGRARPLFEIAGHCPLQRGVALGPDGAFYFGEYFMNPDREPVRVWRVDPRSWEHRVAWTFPAGAVRHVHGIFRDPHDDEALWVATGDLGDECSITRTRDGFGELERFGDGGQQSRAVTLFFTPEHVAWLTDTPLERNHAWRLERATGRIASGQAIDGPTWFGTTTADGLHLAFTTVESGPGVLRHQATVLVSEDAWTWTAIASYDKDRWRPLSVFKAGLIHCPRGPMSTDSLWLSGQALVGFDGESRRVRIDRGGVTPPAPTGTGGALRSSQ